MELYSALCGTAATLRMLVVLTVIHIILWIVWIRYDDVSSGYDVTMEDTSVSICDKELNDSIKNVTVNSFQPLASKTVPITCNITAFKTHLQLEEKNLSLARSLLSGCHRVMYNRVPKCASTTFKDVFAVLAPQHNITAIYLDGSRILFRKLRARYMDLMHAAHHRFILTSHYHFDDFSDVYGDTVAYINIIRDPVEWFKSLYFWITYGSRNRRHNPKNNQTISDCVRDESCINKLLSFQGPRAFLCGQDAFCRNQSAESVTQALDNVDHKYLVVGVYEDLPAYMEVLEYLMPHVFSNLTQVFQDMSDATGKHMETARKDMLDPETEIKLRDRLQLEYDVYHVTKKGFYLLYNAIATLKALRKGDNVVLTTERT